VKKRMRGDDERPQLDQAGEDLIEVTFVTGVDDLEFEAVVPENSIRRDSRGEAESAHDPMRCLRHPPACNVYSRSIQAATPA
jgi:hypothetical protein